MPTLADLRRAWLVKALGLNPTSTLTEADLEAQLNAKTLATAPIEGTGSPEGLVSAPVGTEYVDRNATSGAIKWIKASGAGNTGWRVTEGDTGWRGITASGGTGLITGSYILRRVNSIVFIRQSVLNVGAAPPSPDSFVLPAGFYCTRGAVGLYGQSGSIPNKLYSISVATFNFYGLVEATLQITANWHTDEAWPNPLPGVAG